MVGFQASHFIWRVDGTVAVIQLNRPERNNPLTFDSYAELRDMFRKLPYADDIHAVVFLPNGGNFCSGGDVQEIIGPLVAMDVKQLLAFTRMTGDLVKAMLHCGKPIIAAVDGTAAGAGAIIAMVADLRLATPQAQVAFLFNRVGLAQRIASGPTFANGITKTQLNQEWSMSLDQLIEAEAQAQAICMQTKDFERAYRAFVAKQKPVFEGN
jgi:enoyl-CoA hydratase/carnithine racemase